MDRKIFKPKYIPVYMDIRNVGIIILLAIFLFPMVQSASPSLGIFKQNDNIELLQTCVINGTTCDSCTIATVKVGATSVLSNVNMQKRSNDFNYTFASSKTGVYTVSGLCTYVDVKRPFTYTFEVSQTGLTFGTEFDKLAWLYTIGIALYIIFIIMAWYLESPWLGFLAGVIILAPGIHLMINSFSMDDSLLTRSIAIVLIAIAVITIIVFSIGYIESRRGDDIGGGSSSPKEDDYDYYKE